MKRRSIVLTLLSSLTLLGCSLNADSGSRGLNPAPNPTATVTVRIATMTPTTAAIGILPTPELPDTANTSGDGDSNPPACRIRTEWETYAVISGDTLTSIASRSGTSVAELVQANCLTDANSIRVGQLLHVPVAIAPAVTTDSDPSGSLSDNTAPGCAVEWFVDLGQSEPCPDTARQTASATYQPFEHGFMIWHDGKIWAFYNSGGGISVIDSYDGTEALYYQDPPNGLYHPIRAIGKAWVNFELLRTAQGWATAPEEGYTMTVQSASVSSDSPGGNVMKSSGTHLYTFTLPGNRVMTATITSTQISSWSQPVAR